GRPRAGGAGRGRCAARVPRRPRAPRPPGALPGRPGRRLLPPRRRPQGVRDVVLAVSSAPVEAKASGPNPDYSRARLAIERRGDLVPQVLLWSVLVAAVVVLTALTLRLARSGGDAPPPPA